MIPMNKSDSLIKHIDSKTLVAFTETTPKALLARKYLIHCNERTKSMMGELRKETKKYRAWACASAFSPLFALVVALLPSEFFAEIENDFFFRFVFGTLLGILFSGSALLFGDRRPYISFGFAFLLTLLAPKKHLFFLQGDFFRVSCCLLLAFASTYMLYFPVKFLLSYRSNKQWDKKLQKMLTQAINEETEMVDKELALLIKDFAPEHSAILKALSPKLTGEEEAKEVTAVSKGYNAKILEASKRMQIPLHIGTAEGTGEIIYKDLIKCPHLFAAGISGGGKSNFLNNLIVYSLTPERCNIHLIDPKKVEFSQFKTKKNVVFYCYKIGDAIAHIGEINKELNRRMDLLEAQDVKKLEEYNALKGVVPLQREVIIIDEYSRFSKEIQPIMEDLVCLGRSFGIHFIAANQRYDRQLLTKNIGVNFGLKIAFRFDAIQDARCINLLGAEKIKSSEPGMAMMNLDGVITRVQTPLFPDNATWQKRVAPPRIQLEIREVPGQLKILPATSKEVGAIFGTATDIVREAQRREIKGMPSSPREMGQWLILNEFCILKLRGKRGYWYRIC